MHIVDMAGREVDANACCRDVERTLALPTQHLRHWRVQISSLGNTDDGRSTYQRLIQMRAEASCAVRPEPHIAIDNEAID